MDINKIKEDVKIVINELLDKANLEEKEAVVIGGSTSEVIGDSIGSNTNIEVAEAIIEVAIKEVEKRGLYLIIQGCEHINRALVVEKELAQLKDYEIVNVIPIETAGGGFATAGMKLFKDPVVVEHAYGKAGIDIGDVFIGMHIQGVGVVVRSEIKKIGKAHLSMIRTRKKLIGGTRAIHF